MSIGDVHPSLRWSFAQEYWSYLYVDQQQWPSALHDHISRSGPSYNVCYCSCLTSTLSGYLSPPLMTMLYPRGPLTSEHYHSNDTDSVQWIYDMCFSVVCGSMSTTSHPSRPDQPLWSHESMGRSSALSMLCAFRHSHSHLRHFVCTWHATIPVSKIVLLDGHLDALAVHQLFDLPSAGHPLRSSIHQEHLRLEIHVHARHANVCCSRLSPSCLRVC